jgi:2-dehydro-3-deoxy-D-arabinonate dehydratase
LHLVRYSTQDGGTAVGVAEGDTVTPLPGGTSVAALLRLPLAELRERCAAVGGGPSYPMESARLLPPLDGRMEVWAAGVTYTVSKEARMAESDRAASVYEQVYDADRPELFCKATAWRVVTDSEPICIREDSTVDVPEPELAVVVNAYGETVGYLVCDDVSSRSIEGANPLYLPQAKMYLGACAVSAGVRPVWEVPDPYDLVIEMAISRDGAEVWRGAANTGQLHRRLDDLVRWLHVADVFPDGVVLATGTPLVPELPFTLRIDDLVTMSIGGIGTLTNRVVRGLASMRWLANGRIPGDDSGHRRTK